MRKWVLFSFKFLSFDLVRYSLDVSMGASFRVFCLLKNEVKLFLKPAFMTQALGERDVFWV